MKSQLQIRAETAVAKFDKARRPVVFEFAGVPKAGKTSTITALHAFLKRCGFRVEVVIERASVCPIRDKKHANFNIWTACTTLSQILEKTQNPPRPEDPHILILDRGLFDSICWLSLMEHLERIRPEERRITEQFLKIGDWRKRISAVFVMTVKPEDAMSREQGLLPVESSQGSIMNQEVLQQMLETTTDTIKNLKGDFRIFEIDTSGTSKDGPKRIAEIVADRALNVIEEHLREDILFLPSTNISKLFAGRRFVGEKDAQTLVNDYINLGVFRPREEVESDKDRVQALPIVVIRNKTGDVLRLRRRERDGANPLHEKIVLWAGGHAREEDKLNGQTLVQCAIRELQEELRLSLDPNELVLRGAIYFDQNPKSAQHVAILYEWRAQTDDVAVALSSAEFFERQGTALSGTFVPLNSLVADVESGKISEPWSVEIVREILAKGQFGYPTQLL